MGTLGANIAYRAGTLYSTGPGVSTGWCCKTMAAPRHWRMVCIRTLSTVRPWPAAPVVIGPANGHIRYSTAVAREVRNAQPFVFEYAGASSRIAPKVTS